MAKAAKQDKKKAPSKQFEFKMPQGRRAYAVIVFASAFALYFNSIFNDYNLDDELVTNNQQLTSQGWKVVTPDFTVFSSVQFSDSSFAVKLKYFFPEVFRSLYYQDKSGYRYEYRPLVQASFAIEHALFASGDDSSGHEVYKDNPHISHLINVLLYGFTCVLLFLLLSRLFSSLSILFSFIVTLLFAAHPIHTEVVASIKNRDEIMALMFALASGIYALKFADNRKPINLLLLGLCFLLSLLSKPTTITFAVTIPLALIMFSSISLSGLMIVTSIMAVLAVFYSRLYFVRDQAALFLLILLLVVVAYAARSPQAFWQQFKIRLKSFSDSLAGLVDFKTTETAEQNLDFRFLRKPWLVAGMAVIIAALVFLAGFAAHQNWFWLSCGSTMALALGYVFLRDEEKLILITPITITVLLQLYDFKTHFLTTQIALVLFLCHALFSGNKFGRIVGGINYLFYIIATRFVFHTGVLYPLLGLGMLGFYYPRWLFMSAIALIVSFYYEGFFIYKFATHGARFDSDIFRWVLLQAGLLLAWRGKKILAQEMAIVLLPLLLLAHVIMYPPGVKHDYMVDVQRTTSNLIRVHAVAPTPLQSTVRPMKFVEFPIQPTDPLTKRMGMAAEVLGRYLKLVILPYPMSYYYGYAYIIPHEITSAVPLMSLLLYLGIGFAAVWFYWRKPLVSFALWFYLISISVYTGLVAPIPGIMGDRFLLVPSIGFSILLGLGLFKVFKQDMGPMTASLQALNKQLKYGLIVILLVYSVLTIARNTDWHDHLTLYRHDISTVENSAQAQNLLAVQLLAKATHETDAGKRKDLGEEAIVHFKKALEIDTGFVNASFDLGRTYDMLGRADEAYAQFEHTTVLDTSFVTPCFYMATIQHNKGHYQAAIPLYEKYISKNVHQFQAYANLAYAYYQLKDFDKAVEVNKRVLALDPGSFSAFVNIAKTFIAENQPDSALYYFQLAHRVKPDDHDVNLYIERFSRK